MSNVFLGGDGRLRPICRAVLFCLLAFWLLSADWIIGDWLARAAQALHLTALSPGWMAFIEAANLLRCADYLGFRAL